MHTITLHLGVARFHVQVIKLSYVWGMQGTNNHSAKELIVILSTACVWQTKQPCLFPVSDRITLVWLLLTLRLHGTYVTIRLQRRVDAFNVNLILSFSAVVCCLSIFNLCQQSGYLANFNSWCVLAVERFVYVQRVAQVDGQPKDCALCCHSNATRTTIANPPNSAQLGGIPYHSPKLLPGPCNIVGIRPWTDRQTDTQTQVTTIHFSSSVTYAKCSDVILVITYLQNCEIGPWLMNTDRPIIILIRPHRSTTYVDAAYSYRPCSMVCRLSVSLSVTLVSPPKTA